MTCICHVFLTSKDKRLNDSYVFYPQLFLRINTVHFVPNTVFHVNALFPVTCVKMSHFNFNSYCIDFFAIDKIKLGVYVDMKTPMNSFTLEGSCWIGLKFQRIENIV